MRKRNTHITPKEVWEGIDELRRAQQQTDRQMKETDLQIKKTDRRLKELRDLFTGQWGKLMEALVEGDLVKLLNKKNIQVEKTLQNIKGDYQKERWEIDILAINGNEVVVVEVKTTLMVKHVDRLGTILKSFTLVHPEYKGKKIYGAVAYLKANQSSDSYAEKKGLFVIRATGSSASILNREGFVPKSFF